MRVAVKVVGLALAAALIPSGGGLAFAEEPTPTPTLTSAQTPEPSSAPQSSTPDPTSPTDPASSVTPSAPTPPTPSSGATGSPTPQSTAGSVVVSPAGETVSSSPSAEPIQPAPVYRPGCDQLPQLGLGEPVSVGQAPDLVGWKPSEGALFSDPNTTSGPWVVVGQMLRGIESAAPGSTVYISMYSNTRMEAASAIVRAFCRGVNIHYVTDDHGMTFPASQRIRDFLRQPGLGSSFKACYLSCSSDYTWRKARLRVVTTINPLYRPYMHAKYLTFDSINGVPFVSMVSSGNFTATQMWNGWNNIYTAVNDPTTYAFLISRFKEMIKDTSGNDYAVERSTSAPQKTAYFFPWGVKNPRSSKQTVTSKTDPYAPFIDSIKCTGAAPGYGNSNGRTIVYVSMYQWTSSRLYLARRLKTLKNKGCDVRVLMSAGEWDLEVMPILRAKSRYGNISIRNGDKGDNFIHSKYIIVNGRVGSDRKAKIIWTGSGNFTKSSLRFSNEVSLLVRGDLAYRQFKANWDKMWGSKYSSKITVLRRKRSVRVDT